MMMDLRPTPETFRLQASLFLMKISSRSTARDKERVRSKYSTVMVIQTSKMR
jgi:hypothetical protein